MAYYLKIINVFLLSTVKYFYTPIYAYMIGLDIWGTAIVMISGGIVGFLIYYHISRIIIISTRHLKPFAKIVLPFHLQNHYNNYKHRQKLRRKNKKIFTRKNRLLVKSWQNLWNVHYYYFHSYSYFIDIRCFSAA